MKMILYFIIFHFYLCEAYRQEFARVEYYDPAFIANPKAITARSGRNKPYVTNITGTSLYPAGNNVTYLFMYSIEGFGTEIKLSDTVCNMLKHKWIVETFKVYSIKVACPMPAQYYGFHNLAIPPKDFPFPMPKGDTNVIIELLRTNSTQTLYKVCIRLRTE